MSALTPCRIPDPSQRETRPEAASTGRPTKVISREVPTDSVTTVKTKPKIAWNSPTRAEERFTPCPPLGEHGESAGVSRVVLGIAASACQSPSVGAVLFGVRVMSQASAARADGSREQSRRSVVRFPEPLYGVRMPAFTDEGLARIDAIVQHAVRARQAPGVVVGVASGADVHVSTAGEASVGGPPMRRDTLFRLASVTKPMTAAAVLALVDHGSLGLDDPVGRWLPELRERRVLRRPDAPLTDTVPAEREITVRDLLTFTWGFGMQGAMFVGAQPWPIQQAAVERGLNTFGPPAPATTPDPDTWLARLAELPLMLQPGAKWLYQSGSQVLGVLAARVEHRPFDEVLHERLFAPLGMHDTAFHTTDVDRLATAYRQGDGRAGRVRPAGRRLVTSRRRSRTAVPGCSRRSTTCWPSAGCCSAAGRRC